MGLSNDASELYGSGWPAAAAWNVGACWYPRACQSREATPVAFQHTQLGLGPASSPRQAERRILSSGMARAPHPLSAWRCTLPAPPPVCAQPSAIRRRCWWIRRQSVCKLAGTRTTVISARRDQNQATASIPMVESTHLPVRPAVRWGTKKKRRTWRVL
jgi:hypothetical protein